ncbi:MAG: methyltransferase [Spirochaetes bacterium]|nr:methyltransferase [Spirochaetota bacterium]
MSITNNPNGYNEIFEAQKIAFAPLMFQTALVLRDTAILTALFEKRKEGLTVENIKNITDVPLYGIKVLLDFAVSFNLVTCKEKRYYITKVGYFILKDSMTRVNMDFVQDVCYQGFFSLDKAIMEKRPAGLNVFGDWSTIYEALSQLPEKVQKSWFSFDHFYSNEAFPKALPLVFRYSPRRIMDIGGNTGKWSLQCMEYSPNVEVTIIDLPGQLNKAIANIQEKGYSNRISGNPLNILDEGSTLPEGFDVIWMSQFLDCFSEEQIFKIVQKCAKAMTNETRVCILETFCDLQPNNVATYCINATSLYFTAMANGNSRMYNSTDFIDILEKAGLTVEEKHLNVGNYHTLLICRLNV